MLKISMWYVESLGETRCGDRSSTNAWSLPKQHGINFSFQIPSFRWFFLLVYYWKQCDMCRCGYFATIAGSHQKFSSMYSHRNAATANHIILARFECFCTSNSFHVGILISMILVPLRKFLSVDLYLEADVLHPNSC